MTNARHHILHLTDGNRGGSQRHLIDLVRSENRTLRHFILAVAPDTIGLTDVAAARLLPLDRARVAGDWPALFREICAAFDIGFVHAHALLPLVELADAPGHSLDGVPYGVTLHDLRAVDPGVFAVPSPAVTRDAQWIARCAPVLRRARAVIVPSAWLRDVVCAAYPEVDPRIVANGIAPAVLPAAAPAVTPSPFPESASTYAVVGALGEHKGRATLERVAAAIADRRIAGVVLGYTDIRDEPGWLIPERLYLHGRYEPGELPALLAAYRCRLVYFPNIVPESFSYVLSEVWQAGLPVLAPAAGALGERVRDVGGGWLVDDALDTTAAARRIEELLDARSETMLADARRDIAASAAAVPSLAAMRDAVEDVYRAAALPSAADADAGWSRVAASSRDARFAGVDASLLGAEWTALVREEQSLRAWNAKLVADIAEVDATMRGMQSRFEECLARETQLEAGIRQLKERNERIEADAAALREHATRHDARFATVTARNLKLEGDVSGLTRRNIELQTDVLELKDRNVRVEQDAVALQRELRHLHARRQSLERRLAWLPGSMRKWLLSDG